MIKFLLCLAMMVPGIARANCDWHTIMSVNPNYYEYPAECHLAVGQMKYDLDTANQKLELLNKALSDRAAALAAADKQVDLWQETSLKLDADLVKVDKYQKQNAWLCFGAGVLSAVAVGFAVHSIKH